MWVYALFLTLALGSSHPGQFKAVYCIFRLRLSVQPPHVYGYALYFLA